MERNELIMERFERLESVTCITSLEPEVSKIVVKFTDSKTNKKYEVELELPTVNWDGESAADRSESESTSCEEDCDVIFTVNHTGHYGDIYLSSGIIKDISIEILYDISE